MSREKEIESILNTFAKLYEQNPHINNTTIYNYLCQYNLSKEDFRNGRDYSPLFKYWKEYFGDKRNIKLREWSKGEFLDFENSHDDSECIKLYVSIKPTAMIKSVNEIFSYLEKYNIKHASKVSNKVRSDAIVLRLYNREDVEKISNFINSNKYIVDNSLLTNPFLIRNGIIGMAYDDNMNYNGTISYVIDRYYKSKNNDYSSVNVEDLSNYVENFSYKLMNDKNFAVEYMNTYYFSEFVDKYEEDSIKYEYVNNTARILDIFKYNLNNNDINGLYNEYYKSKNAKSKNIKNIKNLIENKNITNKPKSINYEKIFNDYLELAFEKYKTCDNVLKQINLYMAGNINAITRDNNFRTIFNKQINANIINKITNGNVDSYIKDYLSKKNNKEIFMNICKRTYEKYDLNQLVCAIKHGIDGDYGYFTNDYNLRNKLSSLNKEQFIECLDSMLGTHNKDFSDSIYDEIRNVMSEVSPSKKANIR